MVYVQFRRCSKRRVIGCHYERKVHGDNRFLYEDKVAANRHEVRKPETLDRKLEETASQY